MTTQYRVPFKRLSGEIIQYSDTYSRFRDVGDLISYARKVDDRVRFGSVEMSKDGGPWVPLDDRE